MDGADGNGAAGLSWQAFINRQFDLNSEVAAGALPALTRGTRAAPHCHFGMWVKFFMNQKTIAIIGASADRSKFGNIAVRAFGRQGWNVFPVNPKEAQIENLPAFASIADVPVRPNLISVYLPPPVLLKVLRRW